MAHFFEHLMFKGTPKYPKNEFDRQIQANGGTNNAFTSLDYTGYYENMPSGTLDLILDIESDRMRNLNFDPTEIKNEREVVKEERRYRVENSVFGYLHEGVFETVFRVHPYRWPVVGYMKDLDATSMDDLKEFYRVFYAPNNAVLVITGDFKSGATKSLIEKHYGKIPAQPLPEHKFDPEPQQKSQRSMQLVKDVQSPTFAVAYQAPPAGQDDAYVLDLLANILGNGSSSRLHKQLVYRQQVASSVSAWNYTPLLSGVFQIFCSVKPGMNMESAINTTFNEIYKMRNRLVSDDELKKAKTQVMIDYIDSLKTVSGKARALALNEVLFKDYTMMFKDLDRYNSVTAEQIKAAAEKYLQTQQAAIVRVKPQGAPTSAKPAGSSEGA
jgi:zinc protease